MEVIVVTKMLTRYMAIVEYDPKHIQKFSMKKGWHWMDISIYNF